MPRHVSTTFKTDAPIRSVLYLTIYCADGYSIWTTVAVSRVPLVFLWRHTNLNNSVWLSLALHLKITYYVLVKLQSSLKFVAWLFTVNDIEFHWWVFGDISWYSLLTPSSVSHKPSWLTGLWTDRVLSRFHSLFTDDGTAQNIKVLSGKILAPLTQ